MQLNLSKILIYILALYTFIVIHIATYTPGGSGLYITSNILGWIFVSLIISIGLLNLSKTKVLIISPLFKYLVIGVALLFIPVFYQQSDFYSIVPRFFGLLGGMLVLFSLYQMNFSERNRNKIIVILLVGIIIEAVIGLMQFFVFKYTSIDFGSYEFLKGRPSGVFRQPNLMASFLVTGIFLSLFILKNKSLLMGNKLLKYLIYSCLFSCSVLLILLQSKVGYLAFIISLVFFVPTFIQKINLYKKSLLIIILGIIIGILSMKYLQELDRGEQLYKDNGIRIDVMSVGFDMFKDKPAQGYGYGNFERQYREAHIDSMVTNPSLGQPGSNLDHPHNEILLWGIEGGIIAVFGLLIIIFGFIKVLLKGSLRKNMALMSLLIPIALHTQTEFPFYMALVHFIYFIIITWFIDTEVSDLKSMEVKSHLLAKLMSFLIPLTVIPFMLTTLQTSYYVSKFHKSEFKEPEYISNISNYIVWQSYLDRMIYNINFYVGTAGDEQQHLVNYINWGVKEVEIRPREKVFQNIIVSIEILESKGTQIDQELKTKLFNDAKYLYPERISWGITK